MDGRSILPRVQGEKKSWVKVSKRKIKKEKCYLASSFLENKILRGFVMDLGCDPDLIIKEKKKGIEIVKRKDTR